MNKLLFLSLFLGVGLLLGSGLALFVQAPDQQQSIEWLENHRTIGEFQLDTAKGQFNQYSLDGKWTVVVFGFLNCPDICPTSLSQLASVVDAVDH